MNTTYQQNTNKDLDLGISNLTLTNDKLLVKLFTEDTSNALIEVPRMENYETDGGQLKAKVSNNIYLPKGVVLAISPLATKRLEETLTPIKVGDIVYVTRTSISDAFFFPINRNKLHIPFDGVIAIPSTQIEAHVN